MLSGRGDLHPLSTQPCPTLASSLLGSTPDQTVSVGLLGRPAAGGPALRLSSVILVSHGSCLISLPQPLAPPRPALPASPD